MEGVVLGTEHTTVPQVKGTVQVQGVLQVHGNIQVSGTLVESGVVGGGIVALESCEPHKASDSNFYGFNQISTAGQLAEEWKIKYDIDSGTVGAVKFFDSSKRVVLKIFHDVESGTNATSFGVSSEDPGRHPHYIPFPGGTKKLCIRLIFRRNNVDIFFARAHRGNYPYNRVLSAAGGAAGELHCEATGSWQVC